MPKVTLLAEIRVGIAQYQTKPTVIYRLVEVDEETEEKQLLRAQLKVEEWIDENIIGPGGVAQYLAIHKTIK